MHGERDTGADGDGRGGQPWRRSRPISSEEYEEGDLVAITYMWWSSTCQRPMTVLVVIDRIALVTSPRVGGVDSFPV